MIKLCLISLYYLVKRHIQKSGVEDTVEVAVLDPQEVRVAVGDDGGDLPILLLLHEEGHEVIDLVHVCVAHVVTADQHLSQGEGRSSSFISRMHNITGLAVIAGNDIYVSQALLSNANIKSIKSIVLKE